MIFNNPLVLFLVLAVPIYAWYKLKYTKSAGMSFSSLTEMKKIKPSLTVRLQFLPVLFRSTALILFVIALARPQKGIEQVKLPSEGIDIMLTIDVSTSMYAEDFTVNGQRKNRLEAVKKVVRDFIPNRQNDRIGMIVFAGRAYVQCPLTIDYGIVLQFLDEIKIGMLEDGTAIGDAVAVSLNHMKDTPAKSKVIILLTDGRNNLGRIDPLTAAETAKTLGVKIYTVGAGTKGLAPYPAVDFFGNKVYQRIQVDLDEDTLKKIADITGGMYFRATDTKSLEDIYKQIDEMEKTETEAKIYTRYAELFPYFLLPGLILLVIEIVIANTWLRRIP